MIENFYYFYIMRVSRQQNKIFESRKDNWKVNALKFPETYESRTLYNYIKFIYKRTYRGDDLQYFK